MQITANIENISSSEALKAPELSFENLRKANGLKVEVDCDFSAILGAINNRFSADMRPRESEGAPAYHITIIRPTEKEVLRKISSGQDTQLLEDLQGSIRQFVDDPDVQITGIGFIDGSTAGNLSEKDRVKKATYLAISSPRLTNIRNSLGLAPFDLHITLGFEVGDINDVILGQEDTGGLIKAPIEKKPDIELDDLLKVLPDERSLRCVTLY